MPDWNDILVLIPYLETYTCVHKYAYLCVYMYVYTLHKYMCIYLRVYNICIHLHEICTHTHTANTLMYKIHFWSGPIYLSCAQKKIKLKLHIFPMPTCFAPTSCVISILSNLVGLEIFVMRWLIFADSDQNIFI